MTRHRRRKPHKIETIKRRQRITNAASVVLFGFILYIIFSAIPGPAVDVEEHTVFTKGTFDINVTAKGNVRRSIVMHYFGFDLANAAYWHVDYTYNVTVTDCLGAYYMFMLDVTEKGTEIVSKRVCKVGDKVEWNAIKAPYISLDENIFNLSSIQEEARVYIQHTDINHD